jgi:hypothetical protein
MSARVAIERRDGFAGSEVGSTRIYIYIVGYLQADDLAVGVIVQVESLPRTPNRSCRNYSSIPKPAENTLGMPILSKLATFTSTRCVLTVW